MSAVRVVVTGRVQGVGFRHHACKMASRLGILGWVRNLRDGRVEAWLQGSDACVDAGLEWLRAGGPPAGRVDDLDASPVPPDESLHGFDVR